MAGHTPGGESSSMRRDKSVKRVHFTTGGFTLCNRPKVEGDISFTLRGYAMRRNELPSNMCQICARALSAADRGVKS